MSKDKIEIPRELLQKMFDYLILRPYREVAPMLSEVQKTVMNGYDKELEISWENSNFDGKYKTKYEGVIPNLQRRHKETDSSYVRSQIEEYLDGLEPKEKLETIIKLMPYILPKTSTISHTANEPLDWN